MDMKAIQELVYGTVPSGKSLTYAEQSENYEEFSKIMSSGIKLKDLIGSKEELDAYKRKLSDTEAKLKKAYRASKKYKLEDDKY